jgi:hypothetical protein
LPALNELVGAKLKGNGTPGAATPVGPSAGAAQIQSARQTAGSTLSSRPAIPGDVEEYIFPSTLSASEALAAANLGSATASGLVYRPALFAQAEVRYTSRQYNIDFARKTAVLLEELSSGLVHWEELTLTPIDTHKLGTQAQPNAAYHAVPAWMADKVKVANLGKDFLEWLYRNGTIKIKANSQLKVYAGPDTSDADFQKACAAASAAIAAGASKAGSSYANKLTTLQNKIEAQELDVKAAEKEVTERNLDSVATGGMMVASWLGLGRKKSLSSATSKMRLAQSAKDRLEKEQQTLENLKEQLAALQASQSGVQTSATGTTTAYAVTEIPLSPAKSDIFSDVFGVAWMPYYVVNANGQTTEIPAFSK